MENIDDKSCPFCNVDSDRIIESNEHCLVFRDQYPVTKLHALIIPKRHVKDYFDLNKDELAAINALILSQRIAVIGEDSTVEGFNIGINCGETAGQTIFHCHVHLIPRRNGDVDNPRGGVRGVIPDKQKY